MRPILLVLGCGLLVGGAALLVLARHSGGVAMMIYGCILTLGVAFERFQYKPGLRTAPGVGWQPTGEKSADAHGAIQV